jgi:hypothetical protein
MGFQDPLGDALTSSMARVILSRQPLPGECNARARSSGVARKALGNLANTADAAIDDVGRSRKPRDGATVSVSRPTKAFLDRHPVFVNGEGVEVAAPRFVADDERDALAPGADENRAPRAFRAEDEPAKARVAEGKKRSKELWKKINPGYVGSGTDWHQSEYARALALTAEKLETAKFGVRGAFKHHLAKTDTSAYVEAVAKERIFAKAASSEAARELERLTALAAAGSVKSNASAPGSSAGDAPPPAETAAPAPPPEPNAEGSGK